MINKKLQTLIESNKNLTVLFVEDSDVVRDSTLDMMEEFFIAIFDELITYKNKYKKPIILTCYNTRKEKFVAYLQDHGIPVYFPEEGVRVLIRMWQYAKFLKSK